MAKENIANQKFQGYDKTYIANLLKIVNRDVQNNVQMKNIEYLQLVESACEKFNNDFGDETFDNRGK